MLGNIEVIEQKSLTKMPQKPHQDLIIQIFKKCSSKVSTKSKGRRENNQCTI